LNSALEELTKYNLDLMGVQLHKWGKWNWTSRLFSLLYILRWQEDWWLSL